MRMARTTIRRVNDALAAAGFEGVELVRGNGYFYFSGGDTWRWPVTSVYTNRLTATSVEEWVNEARRLRGEAGWQQAERERIAAGTKRVGDTASERAPSQAPPEPTAVDDFTASMTPMARARAVRALATLMRHNGTVRSRRETVEMMVGDGAAVVVYPVTNPKGRRRLMRPGGAYIEERRLTKTAMDYAEYLLARRLKDADVT